MVERNERLGASIGPIINISTGSGPRVLYHPGRDTEHEPNTERENFSGREISLLPHFPIRLYNTPILLKREKFKVQPGSF